MYIYITEPLCCTAVFNTTLQISYKINKRQCHRSQGWSEIKHLKHLPRIKSSINGNHCAYFYRFHWHFSMMLQSSTVPFYWWEGQSKRASDDLIKVIRYWGNSGLWPQRLGFFKIVLKEFFSLLQEKLKLKLYILKGRSNSVLICFQL